MRNVVVGGADGAGGGCGQHDGGSEEGFDEADCGRMGFLPDAATEAGHEHPEHCGGEGEGGDEESSAADNLVFESVEH